MRPLVVRPGSGVTLGDLAKIFSDNLSRRAREFPRKRREGSRGARGSLPPKGKNDTSPQSSDTIRARIHSVTRTSRR